jgi:hypothetical protein
MGSMGSKPTLSPDVPNSSWFALMFSLDAMGWKQIK